jgi:Flp pilus assembly protein TadG
MSRPVERGAGEDMQIRISTSLRALRRFRRARDGNVAVIFALCAIPIIGSVGAAVDYSRASAVRSSMQQVLDATALMLAKNAGTQNFGKMQALGTKFFKAQFKSKEAKNVALTVSYTQGNSTVQIAGTASVDTTFMSVIGFKKINIGASSTAMWGTKSRLRVALVLDNTGSMASAGKMNALQVAAKRLLAKLNSAAVDPGDVYVSIIPFSKDVNVGTGNSGATWIGWREWDENYGTCSDSSSRTKSSCEAKGKTWTAKSHSTWKGCITDRDQNYDTTNTAARPSDASLPLTTPSTLFPADHDNTCPVQMLAMTNNWTTLNSVIGEMTPTGTTNQSIGLAWGWLSLTPGSVLDPPPQNPGYTYAEHILLLTDGLNTQDRFYKDQVSIDARQRILCDNVKAAGITLWTIQVNTDGDPTSTLLQQCASDPGKFFLLTSADQIISTFENISFKITQLHLSK